MKKNNDRETFAEHVEEPVPGIMEGVSVGDNPMMKIKWVECRIDGPAIKNNNNLGNKMEVLATANLEGAIQEKTIKGNTLSYAGRLELIKTVLQGVECLWLSLFPVPDRVMHYIVKLCRDLLWNGAYDRSKQVLVAWHDVCIPKSEGGLGVLQLHSWNTALLMKYLWNIHAEKSILWIKWITQVYFKSHSVWELSSAKDQSVLIKKLICLQDQLVSFCGSTSAAQELLKVWDGNNTFVGKSYKFLRYNWITCHGLGRFGTRTLFLSKHSFSGLGSKVTILLAMGHCA